MVHPPEPGRFFAANLEARRKTLLEGGRSPKVALYGGSKVVSPKYQCTKAKDGQTGLCVVKEAIEHADALAGWLERLPRQVEWHFERLPALTHKVLNELLKAERRSCPKDLRKELLSKQGHRCALCGGILTTLSSGTT